MVEANKEVLTIEEAAARKIGREWKFSRQALIDWVASGRSAEFYRETTSTKNGSARGEKSRRTAGWRLEFD
jgi:hypothetical protein